MGTKTLLSYMGERVASTDGVSMLLGLNGAGDEVVSVYPSALTPEMFGAASELSATDDTTFIENALEAAIADHLPLLLRRVYRVGEIGIPAATRGLSIIGQNANGVLRDVTTDTGFIPVDDGQSHILKVGEDTGESVNRLLLQNFHFYGDDKEFTKGMLHIAKGSMSSAINVSCLRARGPGLYATKMEDWDWINPQFNCLGSEDYPGGIVFGDKPSGDNFGNNAIKFIGGRVEWCDGGYIITDPTASDPWVSSVFFHGTKVESYNNSGYTGLPVYGDTTPDYPIFRFGNSSYLRTTFGFFNGLISNADNADFLIHLGTSTGFRFEGNVIAGNDVEIDLFHIEDENGDPIKAREFVFRNNMSRNYIGTPTTRSYTFSNKSTMPITFNYPTDSLSPQLNMPRGIIMSSEYPYKDQPTSWMVTDPDPVSDPCLSIGKSVRMSTGDARMAMINTDQLDGYAKQNEGFVRIFARMKRTSASAATAIIRDDTGTIATWNLTTSWAWYDQTVDLRNRGENLRINSTNAGAPSATIYLDCWRVQPTDTLRQSAEPAAGAYIVGDKWERYPPVAGSSQGGVCTVAGSPGTWKDFANIEA